MEKNGRGRDAPGVHSLNRFVVTVPDLGEAQRFYESFGLRVVRAEDRIELFTEKHPHCWASLHAGERRSKRLEYLSFGCYEGDFESFASHASRLATCPPHRLAGQDGLWLLHPDGFPVQIVTADKSSPDLPSPIFEGVRAGAKPMAPSRSRMGRVTPRRLSHVLTFSPDVLRAVAFYEEALGLRLSDRSGDGIAFMHGAHGSDHHLIAVAKSDARGLHHCSWDVGTLDEVGAGMEQMRAAGYAKAWGVGRHVLGSNYFCYVRDPWGSYSEYSYDIDFISKGQAWAAGDHPPADSFYLWGPPVPEDFVTNFEIGND